MVDALATTEHTNTYPPNRRMFDWLFVAASAWFVGGLYLDGWAHNHLDTTLETFFTPWHAVFYSGFAAVAAISILQAWINHKRGFDWRHALPVHYMGSLLGVAIFFAAGVIDLFWHTFLGIEASVEALLSPPHLLLATGGSFIVAGPLRRIWYERVKTTPTSLFNVLPELLSYALLWAFISFMTQFVHPVSHPFMLVSKITVDHFHGQALGMANVLIQTVIFMGLYLAARRFRFPAGSFLLLFGITTIMITFMKDEYRFILPAILGGFLVDVLYQKLKPHDLTHPRNLRLFSFFAPLLFYACYVAAAAATEPTWWSVHLWTGQIVIAGIVGWLLSYVAVSPFSGHALQNK